ncbi:hypothetical protein BJX99DRAFT_173936 [Aspergillus californicus]
MLYYLSFFLFLFLSFSCYLIEATACIIELIYPAAYRSALTLSLIEYFLILCFLIHEPCQVHSVTLYLSRYLYLHLVKEHNKYSVVEYSRQ